MNKTLTRIFLVLFAAGLCMADDAGDPNGAPKEKEKKAPKQLVSSSLSNKNEKSVPRIWFGLTGSYTPLKLLKANNGYTDSNSNSFSATTAQGQAGGGAILNVRLFSAYWLSLGSIYRFVGYDATEVMSDLNSTSYFERSRSRFLDFPVMLRYSGKKWNVSKHTFYELGGTFRDDISTKITTSAADVNGELPAGQRVGMTNFPRTAKGATAGFGAIARDDFGIIVSPEVRYTYWLGAQSISSNLVGSNRNQLEVTVSFGF